MTAEELTAKIAADHERLRALEARIASGPPHQRRQFDAMIKQARDDITRLQIQLACLAENCPVCGDAIPHSFLVCRACMQEVPLPLHAAYKGAVGLCHHKLLPPHVLERAKAALISHLKQHGSGAGLLAA